MSFALRASIGNYAYNNVQSNREAWDGSQMYDQTGFLKNRLTSAWKTNFKTGQYRSSYYVQNASFVRMDNISLGYTILTSCSMINKVHVFMSRYRIRLLLPNMMVWILKLAVVELIIISILALVYLC